MKGRDTKEGLYVRGYMRKLGLAKLPLNFFWDKVETGSMNPTLGEESGWKRRWKYCQQADDTGSQMCEGSPLGGQSRREEPKTKPTETVNRQLNGPREGKRWIASAEENTEKEKGIGHLADLITMLMVTKPLQ